jgi:hypothetical protein
MQRIYQRYSYQTEMNDAWGKLAERLEALTSGKETAMVIPIRSKA